jgi:hypothetical protein
MREFELDSIFCSNPDCELHVRAGMPGVAGRGSWAQLQDGRIIGRQIYCGVFLCDGCLQHWNAVAAFFPDGAAIGLGASIRQ